MKRRLEDKDSTNSTPSAIFPAAITTSELEKVLKGSNEEKGKIIIFKRNSFNSNDNAILTDFEKLLSTKPVGTWLIRESRRFGMISISVRKNYMQEGQQCSFLHQRYAFVKGIWIVAEHKSMKPHLHITRTTIADGYQSLLDAIFLEQPTLTKDRLLLPTPDQCTQERGYSGYCVVVSLKPPIFNSPITALNKISQKIDSLLQSDAEIVKDNLLLQEPWTSLEELKQRFYTWTVYHHLHDDITSPISLEMFTQPYVLDSGNIFDKTDIYHNDTLIEKCPLTRKPINTTPHRFEGWNEALENCLNKFKDLIEQCSRQEKTQAIITATTVSSHTNSATETILLDEIFSNPGSSQNGFFASLAIDNNNSDNDIEYSFF